MSQRQQKCDTKLHSPQPFLLTLTDVSTDCLETNLMSFELWNKNEFSLILPLCVCLWMGGE